MTSSLQKHRHWIALISIGAFAIFYSRKVYAPCDDAYIFLVYAKNWIGGNGPTFNGAVVEGFSSPLWLGFLTLFGLTGIPLPTLMQIFSTLGGLLAIFATYQLTSVISGSRDWAVLAALLLAATGDFAFYFGVGLEEVLFAALLALAAAELAEEPTTTSLSGFKLPGLLALSILTRPEGALFAGLFLLWGIASTRKVWPAIRSGLVLTGLLVPVLVVKRMYYGYWLPNTYFVKANAGIVNLAEGKIYFAQNSVRYIPLVGILVLLLLSAVLVKHWKVINATLPLLAISAIWGIYILVRGGDNLVGGRILIPALPLVIAAMIAIMQTLLGKIWRAVALVAVLGAFGIIGYAQSDLVNSHATRWRRNFPVRQAAGLYLKENFPEDTLVALNPAGIIPFYSELPTIDMLGLNDETIGHFGQRNFSLGFGHQAGDGAYVLSRKPDVILFGGGVSKTPGDLLSDRQIAADPAFLEYYVRVPWPGIGYAYLRVNGDQ